MGVFASLEWVYYLFGTTLSFEYYVPFWNHFKFALILWLQLPYIPIGCNMVYEYIIIPFRCFDLNKYEKKNDDEEHETEQQGKELKKARKSFKISDDSMDDRKNNDLKGYDKAKNC